MILCCIVVVVVAVVAGVVVVAVRVGVGDGERVTLIVSLISCSNSLPLKLVSSAVVIVMR